MWDSVIGRLARMDDERTPREILRENLQALMKKSARYQSLSTIKKIAAASNGVLANGTVGRMVKGDSATDIDKLGELAKVFELQAWQLLVPGIKAEALPVLADRKYLAELREVVRAEQSPAVEHASEPKRLTQTKRAALTRAKNPPTGRRPAKTTARKPTKASARP